MDPIRVIHIALRVLGERGYSLLVLLMTFSLFCWAMWQPTYERLGIAAFFALAVYLPTTRIERKANVSDET